VDVLSAEEVAFAVRVEQEDAALNIVRHAECVIALLSGDPRFARVDRHKVDSIPRHAGDVFTARFCQRAHRHGSSLRRVLGVDMDDAALVD
jgi:hypothetical protein